MSVPTGRLCLYQDLCSGTEEMLGTQDLHLTPLWFSGLLVRQCESSELNSFPSLRLIAELQDDEAQRQSRLTDFVFWLSYSPPILLRCTVFSTHESTSLVITFLQPRTSLKTNYPDTYSTRYPISRPPFALTFGWNISECSWPWVCSGANSDKSLFGRSFAFRTSEASSCGAIVSLPSLHPLMYWRGSPLRSAIPMDEPLFRSLNTCINYSGLCPGRSHISLFCSWLHLQSSKFVDSDEDGSCSMLACMKDYFSWRGSQQEYNALDVFSCLDEANLILMRYFKCIDIG